MVEPGKMYLSHGDIKNITTTSIILYKKSQIYSKTTTHTNSKKNYFESTKSFFTELFFHFCKFKIQTEKSSIFPHVSSHINSHSLCIITHNFLQRKYYYNTENNFLQKKMHLFKIFQDKLHNASSTLTQIKT